MRYSTSGLRLADRRLPGRRVLAQDLVGILAGGQPGDPDVLELDARIVVLELADEPGQGGHAERAGLLAGRVDVVGEHDPARVARQQRDLARRQRRPQAGDDVLEAGLVGHQGVGIALDDDGLAAGPAHRPLGPVDEVERPALVEQRRRRGVEVLGPLPFQQPAAEPDRVAVLVADREEDAGPELVDDAVAALARAGEPDLDQLLAADVALGLELAGHDVPAGRRPAELVALDGRVGEAAGLEVVEGGLAGLRAGQDRVVEGDRGVHDLAQAGPAGVLALGALVDLDAGLRGERAQRLRKGRAVALHDEAEDVAAQAAAEAVPALAGRGDDERRRLLAVERAQALVGGSRLLQRDGLADHVDDRQLALDFGSDADRQTLTPSRRSSRRRFHLLPPMPTARTVPDMAVGLSSLDKPGRPT